MKKFVLFDEFWWHIKDVNASLKNVKLYNITECGNCGEHDVSGCKIAYANDWDGLDWKDTELCSNKEKTGWLSPDGSFYGCDYHLHSMQAELVHHHSEGELEKLGWIKITRTFEDGNRIKALFIGNRENHIIKPTESQMDYLTKHPEIDLKQIGYRMSILAYDEALVK